MQYVLVEWEHDMEDEPYLIYSELNEDRMETRKMEFYRNGLSFSYGAERGHFDVLADVPFPSDLREIERQGAPGEFTARSLSPSLFYDIWNQTQERPDGFMGMFF